MLQRTREVHTDGHLDVLGCIPPAYVKAVLEQCKRRVLARGELIWSQGEPSQYVAFLVSGKAMSWFQARNGKTGTTGFWCAGDLLGAADVGAVSARQQTVRCLEECMIYTLSFERFEDLVRRFPEVGLAVIRAMSVRLRWVAQLAVTLETQPAFERICAVLLSLSEERFAVHSNEGVLINLKLTNGDLAAIAGVTRQFTNATLHDLRQRGLLITRRQILILTDRAAIEKLANQQ